ncbi:MAG: PadR family transcriptional regulator [Candidatus Aenigmarchaeota archaeon]|nr:PadR family transcriptional regulator [Candidatus Aenigmarchaeota archaeon]
MDIKITNMVKFYTLLLLAERDKHGYEIIKEISSRTGKTVSPGQIYPFLKLLEKRGYIKSGEPTKRDKTQYRLTKDGKAFVQTMLARFGDLVRLAVEPSIEECAHCGCKVYSGGYKKKIKNRQLSFCCQYCAKSFKI